ncbi:MAG TPA: hypothetical protein DCZ03_14510 [Gammaproteobacteria bacterium]|nr:hypothetical protein [Gammaproteobacteria bacterium]
MFLRVKFSMLVALYPLLFGAVQAQDSVMMFSIEPRSVMMSPLNFPETDGATADASNFEIKDYLLLSNGLGERRAVVTLINTATGQRILEGRQISARFANGDSRNAIGLSQKFSSQEHLTLNINFGRHIYPIMSISVQTVKQPN